MIKKLIKKLFEDEINEAIKNEASEAVGQFKSILYHVRKEDLANHSRFYLREELMKELRDPIIIKHLIKQINEYQVKGLEQ
ncbi:MAG: hypothetical protein ACPG5Z_08570 [Pseudoalteromonas sp.]